MLRLLIAFIFYMVGLFQPDAMSCVSTSCIASEFDVHTICDKTTHTSSTPVAKVTDGERYTIVHDYLGTPTQAYDSEGNLVWEMLLDVYGEVMESRGDRSLVPFRYQGQYEDEETGLYYNRFRYYSPQMGVYISSDPIGLAGNNPTLYGYVGDVNTWLDPWGLMELFRSVNRSEYYDVKNNGWRPNGGSMEGKWFAENYEDAVNWGHKMGHGSDTKFYILTIEIPDNIATTSFKHSNLDGIGDAQYFDVDTLNQHGKIIEVNSIRTKCK